MTIFQDMLGQRVPHGRVHKQLRWEVWNDSALPAWLTTTSGTFTYDPISSASNRGTLAMSLPTSVGGVADLAVAFAIDTSQFKRIDWTFEGLVFNAVSGGLFSVEIAIDGTNKGIIVHQNHNENTAEWNMLNAAGNTADAGLHYLIRGTHRRNLTLTVLPKEEWACLRQDDQVLGVMTAPEWNDGQMTPRFKMTNNTTSAHWARVAAVVLELEHN